MGKCTIEVIEATETSTECPDGGSLWQLIAIAEGPGCLTGAKLHRSTKGMPWVGCHHLAAIFLPVHPQADYLTTSCNQLIPDILGTNCRSCRRTVGKEPNVPTVASSADSGPLSNSMSKSWKPTIQEIHNPLNRFIKPFISQMIK